MLGSLRTSRQCLDGDLRRLRLRVVGLRPLPSWRGLAADERAFGHSRKFHGCAGTTRKHPSMQTLISDAYSVCNTALAEIGAQALPIPLARPAPAPNHPESHVHVSILSMRSRASSRRRVANGFCRGEASREVGGPFPLDRDSRGWWRAGFGTSQAVVCSSLSTLDGWSVCEGRA